MKNLKVVLDCIFIAAGVLGTVIITTLSLVALFIATIVGSAWRR